MSSLFLQIIYFAGENPGVRFERLPNEVKIYEGNTYPSELAGPSLSKFYLGFKFSF